ncbi:MFS transporter [Reyranella sp.]|uniref:MFS transporter n=1 Tax=Reyranella sp. TaxID=1929291 RepID=UPI003D0D2E78
METNKRYHGWWVVFCSFVIALYGWGLGFYGLSLYLVALQKAQGWSPATISSAVTFYYIAGAFLVMQVGDVIHKRGARPVVIAGAGLMGVGVLCLTVIDRPWQLYLAFLLMIPGWAAMGGGSINTIIAQWFNRRRGLAASLALNGATCGGLLFAPAFAWAIDTLGFATACMAAVAFVLATLWPLALFALRPRRDGEHDAGDEPSAAHDIGGEPMSRGQLLREPRYLTMVGAFSLGLLAQISFISHQVAYLEPTLGLKGAGWAVSATSLSALVGRLAVGLVIDRVDRRAASAAVLCVQVSAMIVLLSSESLFGLYLGCVLFGFGVGNLITLPGLIVQQEFPRRDFARAVSLNVAINQLVAATGPSILGVLHDLSGSYRTSLMVCLALQLAAAILVLFRPRGAVRDA